MGWMKNIKTCYKERSARSVNL